MANTKRYLVAHRFGPRLDVRSEQQLKSFVASVPEASVVDRTLVGRYIANMTPDQARDLARTNPSLVVEEDHPLMLFGPPGLPPRVPAEGEFTRDFLVTDATTGKPAGNVTIYGVGSGVSYKAATDADGRCTLRTFERSLSRVVASPADTFWSRVLPEMDMAGDRVDVALKPLLTTGAFNWGLRLMAFPQANQFVTGREVKIGLVDSGISAGVADIHPSGGYNTLDGQDPNSWNVDEEGHGTHTAGTLAARDPVIGALGGAPEAAIYSVKVFPGGFTSDLVEAVEWCIQNGMDVISMSLGSHEPSTVLAAALRDAYDRGITCVAAAGNEATSVAYPAAFPTVIAVGAVGRLGVFPEDSRHQLTISRVTDWYGGLFAGNFSNFGPEVEVCAPGVAVLSTVPTGYACWDGTSMACPHISSLVALMLEAAPHLRTGDAQQVQSVRAWLAGSAANLGMPPFVQGHGLPIATRALGALSAAA